MVIPRSLTKFLSNPLRVRGTVLALSLEHGPPIKEGHMVITPMGYGTLFSKIGVGGRYGIMVHSHHYPKYFPVSQLKRFFVATTGSKFRLIPLMPHYYHYFLGGEKFVGTTTKKGFAVPTRRWLKDHEWVTTITQTPNGLTMWARLDKTNVKFKKY